MSALVSRRPADQWATWRAMLAGQCPDFDPRDPPSGYWRSRERSLAVWRDEGGDLRWMLSGGYKPHRRDEFCDLFASFAPHPVTYEIWSVHCETGRWPEDPSAEIEAAREPTIGHNSATPREIILDDLDTLDRAWRDWLASIGGSVLTEEHDAKSEQFRRRFAEIEGRASDAHRDEKAPHFAAGRAVDEAWREPRARADAGKREIGRVVTPYRLKRDDERREAEAIAAAEAKAARDAAKAVGEPAPIPMRQVKPATGLRTKRVLVITDLAAACAAIAGRPAADMARRDLEDAVRKIARALAPEAVAGTEIVMERTA